MIFLDILKTILNNTKYIHDESIADQLTDRYALLLRWEDAFKNQSLFCFVSVDLTIFQQSILVLSYFDNSTLNIIQWVFVTLANPHIL